MDFENIPIEIIKDKLYFLINDKPPTKVPNAFYFSIDEDLQYEPFYEDFGPLNLARVWKFCAQLEKILSTGKDKNQKTKYYHLTSTDYKKHTNAVLLICSFQLLILGRSAEESYSRFIDFDFKPFRDASYGQCTYECTILDCIRGLEYAMKLDWFNFKTFNITEYEHYERVQNGDLNWVVPNKFVAFSSPSDEDYDHNGYKMFSPKDYVPIFKKIGVDSVVRLNTKTYDSQGFIKENINHHQLYFPDGTAPSEEIAQTFLKLTENDHVFAIHCKAGLGRTGTLIGLYAMKHYMFKAADFIGWIRLCRPGSILGPQQYFMIKMEKVMRQEGKTSKIWKEIKEKWSEEDVLKQLNSMSVKSGKMNEKEKKIESKGEKGQGDKLVLAKNKLNTKK